MTIFETGMPIKKVKILPNISNKEKEVQPRNWRWYKTWNNNTNKN